MGGVLFGCTEWCRAPASALGRIRVRQASAFANATADKSGFAFGYAGQVGEASRQQMVQLRNPDTLGNQALKSRRAGIGGLTYTPGVHPPAAWPGRRTIHPHGRLLRDFDFDGDVGSLEQVALSLNVGQSWKTVCCSDNRQYAHSLVTHIAYSPDSWVSRRLMNNCPPIPEGKRKKT